MNLLAFQEYQVYQEPHFDQGAQVFQDLQGFLAPQAFQGHLQVLFHQLHLFHQEGLKLRRVNHCGSEITLKFYIPVAPIGPEAPGGPGMLSPPITG